MDGCPIMGDSPQLGPRAIPLGHFGHFGHFALSCPFLLSFLPIHNKLVHFDLDIFLIHSNDNFPYLVIKILRDDTSKSALLLLTYCCCSLISSIHDAVGQVESEPRGRKVGHGEC